MKESDKHIIISISYAIVIAILTGYLGNDINIGVICGLITYFGVLNLFANEW